MTAIIQTALQLIKSKMFPWILIAVFGVVIYFLYSNNNNLKSDNKRLKENIVQSEKTNTIEYVTKDELKRMLKEGESRTINHLDSLLKKENIKPNQLNEYSYITNVYKDTTKAVIPVPRDTTPKPFEINSDCMAIRGEISNDQLTIKERYYSNEIDVISYLIPKKIWFIRVGWKGENIKAFSKCGEVAIKSYKKVKQ